MEPLDIDQAQALAKIIARWQADPQGEAEKRLLGALPYYNTLLLEVDGYDSNALLAAARSDYARQQRQLFEVDCSQATDFREALASICLVVTGSLPETVNGSMFALDCLRALGQVGEHRQEPLVIVHGLEPGFAHTLFGRLRDEVWETRLRWLVVGDPAGLDSYMTPPADSFFTEIVPIRPVLRELGFDTSTRGFFGLAPDSTDGPSL